jgi:hypothetical protein
LSFVGWVDGSWVEREAGVGQEPDHQILVFADPLNAPLGGVGDAAKVVVGRFASSTALRLAHRYSTGFSSGA